MMIKIIVGIFFVLVAFLIKSYLSGDIITFFAWWLLGYYVLYLVIYFGLYAVIALISDKPLTLKAKALLGSNCFLCVANLRNYFLRTKQIHKKNRKKTEQEMSITERPL